MNGMWIDIEGRGDDFKTDGYIKRALRDATHKFGKTEKEQNLPSKIFLMWIYIF